MSLFSDHAESNHSRAVALVEGAVESLGIDAAAVRIDGGEGESRYSLRRGSADVVITVIAARGDDEEGTLRIVAPVVRLPGEGDWSSLYAWLLSSNAQELRGAAFGLIDGEVVVVAERSLVDLDASEVLAMVKTVGAAADRYDDVLAKQFGTPRSSDK